jgi:hypothetical protein
MAKRHIGSSFADFLVEEDIKEDVDLLTLKKVLADEIELRMEKSNLKVAQLSKMMSTSRNQVYRLLDERDTGVTLTTLSNAAKALKSNIIELLTAAASRASAPSRRHRAASAKRKPPASSAPEKRSRKSQASASA